MLLPLLRRIHARMNGSWAIVLCCAVATLLVVVPLLVTLLRTCFHIDVKDALINLTCDVLELAGKYSVTLAMIGGALALCVLLEYAWERHRTRMSETNINRFVKTTLDSDIALQAWLESPEMIAERKNVLDDLDAQRNKPTHD